MDLIEGAKHVVAAVVPGVKTTRLLWAETEGYYRTRADKLDTAGTNNFIDGIVGFIIMGAGVAIATSTGHQPEAFFLALGACESAYEGTITAAVARHRATNYRVALSK